MVGGDNEDTLIDNLIAEITKIQENIAADIFSLVAQIDNLDKEYSKTIAQIDNLDKEYSKTINNLDNNNLDNGDVKDNNVNEKKNPKFVLKTIIFFSCILLAVIITPFMPIALLYASTVPVEYHNVGYN